MTLAQRLRLDKTLRMNDLALSVRLARPTDAAELARIYIESWHDAYAGILSHALLAKMSLKGQTARWEATMRGPGIVLVAEDANEGPVGLASLGAARDRGLGLDGEIYTLYVDPAFQGRGTGRALLHAAFSSMQARNYRACVIWAHARNNACFFYEAMGGKRVAERTTGIMGEPTPEIAFGWKRLHVGDKVLRS
jgi:ribosomal protein S18 acetylase RimI-like enzyme